MAHGDKLQFCKEGGFIPGEIWGSVKVCVLTLVVKYNDLLSAQHLSRELCWEASRDVLQLFHDSWLLHR